jgi:DNA helicase-2/ATP-dependent DNA helicase PcrA
VFGLTAKTAQRLPGHLKEWRDAAQDDSQPANLVRDHYRLLRLLGVHKWETSDDQVAARMGTLARFSELLADFEHVRRRAGHVWESGQPVIRGGVNRGPWHYQDLFTHLQYYALEAYEDFEGEEKFDLEAVDLLTVHQAKGLEWPVVFVPCMVAQRFPSKYAGRKQGWLVPKGAFPVEARRR